MSTVQHPAHYGGADNPYEAIKVIEAWGLGFHLGNAIKYINRAGKKGDRLEDLRKAAWYIEREIARLTAPDVTGEAGGASEDPVASATGSEAAEVLCKSDCSWPGSCPCYDKAPEAAEKALRVGARVRIQQGGHHSAFIAKRIGMEGTVLRPTSWENKWCVELDGDTAPLLFFPSELEVIG